MQIKKARRVGFLGAGLLTLAMTAANATVNEQNMAAASVNKQNTEEREPIEFTPDFTTEISGQRVGVDIDLLTENGELTAGFVASLDPHHGDSWRTMPDPQSTSPSRILQIIAHMEEHDISASQIYTIYRAARTEWVKKYQPDEAPSPQE